MHALNSIITQQLHSFHIMRYYAYIKILIMQMYAYKCNPKKKNGIKPKINKI